MNSRTIAANLLLFVIATAAVSLLSLSWPRLQASFTYLPVDTAIAKYFANREIPSGQLNGLIERARQAIARHDHYRYHDGLSVLYYLRGLDTRSPTLARRPAFEQALMEAEKVVSAAPARSVAWQRIARTHALLGHDSGQIMAALKMSIYAGRVEPALFIGRLELGYRYLASLDDELLGLLRDQTLLTWKLQPRELTAALREQRIDRQGVETVLGGRNDGVLKDMEASIGVVR